MKQLMQELRENALQAINQAVDMETLEALRVKYLGKKGELTAILKQMGKLSAEERPVMGQLANSVRAAIEERLEQRKAAVHAAVLEAKLAAESIDVTIPGDEITSAIQRMWNYKFFEDEKNVSITTAARYIGNAVPPRLGEVIADSIIKQSVILLSSISLRQETNLLL